MKTFVEMTWNDPIIVLQKLKNHTFSYFISFIHEICLFHTRSRVQLQAHVSLVLDCNCVWQVLKIFANKAFDLGIHSFKAHAPLVSESSKPT